MYKTNSLDIRNTIPMFKNLKSISRIDIFVYEYNKISSYDFINML